MKLAGKVVLITGASQGIGSALAVGMAKQGGNIIVNYLTNREGAEQTVAQVCALGRKAFLYQADVGSVEEIDAMFRQVRETFGRLDVLVNNAAITGWTDLFQVTERQYDQVMAT